MTESLGTSDGRALRVKRCSQERRQCARRARVKTFSGWGGGDGAGVAFQGKMTVSLRTTFSHSRRMRQRGQSFQSTEARGGRQARLRGEGKPSERRRVATTPHSPAEACWTAFLTLRAQGTVSTMANTCGIQDPQGAMAFGPALLGIERVISRATQRPIRLQDKSGAGKASGKGRTCPLGRSIRHL